MVKKCECIDCMKAESYSRFLNRPGMIADHLEENTNHLDGLAGDFIGGQLIALKPIVIYAAPPVVPMLTGNYPVRTVKTGNVVGTIISYVKRGDNVWWQVQDGFVLHEKGNFDDIAMKLSLDANEAKKQKKIDAVVKERKDANTNPLYNAGESFLSLGSSLKWVIISVVALIVTSLVIKLVK